MDLCRYSELLKRYQYDGGSIPYRELLKTCEWWSVREEVLKRDQYKCSQCGNGETIKQTNAGRTEYFFVSFPPLIRKYRNNYDIDGICDHFYIYEPNDLIYTMSLRHSYLHVHHTYYCLDYLPWQYDLDSLQTLCVHCHFALHQSEKVPVYKVSTNGCREEMALTCCERCNGAGLLPEFDYYMSGICFQCWGVKYKELIRHKDICPIKKAEGNDKVKRLLSTITGFTIIGLFYVLQGVHHIFLENN